METFSPTVMVDGFVVKPEGWMWVLAFALGGCGWALDLVCDPSWDLAGKIADFRRRKCAHDVEVEIESIERRLEVLRATRSAIWEK